MKKVIFGFCVSLITFFGYAQQTDNRLLSVYSEQELSDIKKNDIELFNALVYGLDHALYVTDLPKEKDITDVQSITLPKENYTYASLGLRILEDKNQYLKINGTNKLLVVKSAIVLKNELKYKK